MLDAASQLFVTKGYDETTFDDIASLAQVARQTAFNHFRRKEDFVTAWGARRRGEIDRLLNSATFDGKSTAARLVLTFRVLANSYERDAAEGRVFTVAWVRLGGPIFEAPTLAVQFAEIFAAGQRSGELRADIDAATAGRVLRAAYFDVLWEWASPRGDDGAATLFSGMLARLDVVVGGLYVSTHAGQLREALRLAQAVELLREAQA